MGQPFALREAGRLLPEIALLVVAALSLFTHIFFRKSGRRRAGYVTLVGLSAAIGILLASHPGTSEIVYGSLIVDPLAVFFKLSFLVAGILTIVLAFRFFDIEKSEPGEIYALLPLSMIGMMAAVSSVDLITTYVAFELFAIPSYILAGIFKKDRRSAEAGIKYFFLGTLSSALTLLGMALVFGLAGETNYAAIAKSLAGTSSPAALTGMILFFAGLFFKAALVPFHMWAPDVYEGAPTPLVIFLSTAPKAAVFAMLARLVVGPFEALAIPWSVIFQVVAVVTMFWGNIAALLQKNVKRMMAYSSIAQAGYIMIGLAAWGEAGRWAVSFYVLIYVLMNAAAFGMILLIRKGNGFGESVDDFRGLAGKSPAAAAAILVLLLSLTGIPPTAGFMGKYFLFAAAIGKNMIVLAALGALNSVISLFYYFRVGRAVFLEEDRDGALEDSAANPRIVLAALAISLLVLGIFPSLVAGLAGAPSLGK